MNFMFWVSVWFVSAMALWVLAALAISLVRIWLDRKREERENEDD